MPNMAENKKYVELLWVRKYERFEKGEKIPIEKPNLPFQVVETINEPRIRGGLTSPLFPENQWPKDYPRDWRNLLIWGDNKLVMSSLIKQGWAGKINLIYIDPPFFTGADFTVKTKIGSEEIEKEPSIIEERAYKDTWSGGIASYLKYMYERLVLMRELLAENGSIYVHLDWHVGHYVKVMMDEIFGYGGERNEPGFRNEICRCYGGGGAPQDYYPKKHDTLFWYSKGNRWTFNKQFRPYTEGTLERGLTAVKGPKYKLSEEGAGLDDWWADNKVQKILSPTAYENLKFENQKPEGLLKRIIIGHSNPGDIVADFFCGSGTTLAVVEKLGQAVDRLGFIKVCNSGYEKEIAVHT